VINKSDQQNKGAKFLNRYDGNYLVVERLSDARPIQNPRGVMIENEEGEKEWRFGDTGIQEWIGKDGTKIHRYCRLARFKQTLDELIGMKGRVKKEIVEECEVLDGLEDVERTWEVVRSYLKRIGKRKYYNRIPMILGKLGYPILEGYTWEKYLEMLNDFEKMHQKFMKRDGVSYFPNLRFICFKLMEKYGVRYRIKVPMVRTLRKKERLDLLWDELNSENGVF
jgi:hypothetical protein